MFHGFLALRQWHRGTTLRIRNEQRPRLTDAIAPLCDIVALQSTARLVARVLLHQFTLAAHRLLAILPGVIEVREIDANTDGSTHERDGRSLQEPCQLLLLDGLYQPGNHHRQDDKQIIVGHLHVVRIDLEGRKDSCQQQSPEVFSPIGQYDTRNHRWQISQCPYLPDMACSNDNEEIGGEGPYDTS